MLASRILSRFLPNTESGTLDPHDDFLEAADDIPRSSTSNDHELDALLAEAEEEDFPVNTGPRRARWQGNANIPHSDVEDDVPHSLLMEGGTVHPQPQSRSTREQTHTSRVEEQWRRAQDRQPLHAEHDTRGLQRQRATPPANQHAIDAKEQALWLWTNVQNLDAFLLELYEYYAEHGIWSILFSRAIALLTAAFMFGLYIFMTACIDYSKIPEKKSSSEVIVEKCMQRTSLIQSLLLWIFTFWWLWQLSKYVMDVRRLWSLHEFYHHLLGIPDTDLQTVSWERIVEDLMKLRNSNARTADNLPRFVKENTVHQSKQRMDAHDIANRLMRKDNYFVALFNKEIFDLSLPIPFLGHRQFYSKSLEFCIEFCFQDFIFDHQGQVKPSCLKRQDRQHLINTLRRRLRFTAIMSIILAPANIGAHCVVYFSRYYAEFRSNPTKIGARAFTPLAEWKFREFNELPHNFKMRMKMAYAYADGYLNQFPRDKTIQLLQFVSLVSGTLAGLLGLATLLDPELFLGFEITPGRTAVFYIGILMAVFAAARGSIPDESEVHEPVMHLLNVIQATHYHPARWNHQLHSNDVRVEFSSLYQMKILIFLEEIMSLIIAPFILWQNSGQRSEMIIDFFRNSTVQVDGLGYLCTFSVFDFRKSKNVEDDAMRDVEDLREEYFGTKDDKTALSQYHFMERVGLYDQKHGVGRHRPHFGMQLPPSFPPIPSIRQATSPRHAGEAANRKHPLQPSAYLGRAPSPQRSVLLDLNQRPSNIAPSRRGRNQTLPARKGAPRRGAGDTLSPDEGDEDDVARMDALTTSRLIEQDNTLGDSWKTLPRKQGVSSASQASETQAQLDKGPSNGVLGLLVEYSKAHAAGKGPKIG